MFLATVCRVIQRLGPLLAPEPVQRPRQAADRLWIVDGTLVPVRDRTMGTSSRNYRFSANVRAIVDADIRLVIATARPVPGTTAHAKAWRESGPHVIGRMKNHKILRDCRQHGHVLNTL